MRLPFKEGNYLTNIVTDMKKSLLNTALIVGSLAVSAFAGSGSMMTAKPITGSLSAGYDSAYSFHNIVPTTLLLERGATTIGADLKYEIPSTVNVLASFSNTQLDSQSPLLKDETNVYVGLQGEAIEGLSTAFGYNLVRGGLPGMFSNMHKFSVSNGYKAMDDGCDMDHLLRFDVKYQVKDSGLFFTGGVAYSVHGTEGWLMNVGAGYDWMVNDQVNIILSGDASFSQKYISWIGNDGKGVKYNGTDGYSITLAAPIKATRTVTITPWIAATWAGHNPIAFDKAVAGPHVFEDFMPTAGITASWSF